MIVVPRHVSPSGRLAGPAQFARLVGARAASPSAARSAAAVVELDHAPAPGVPHGCPTDTPCGDRSAARRVWAGRARYLPENGTAPGETVSRSQRRRGLRAESR
eukprot:1107316-Prymnesium_polylepis.1